MCIGQSSSPRREAVRRAVDDVNQQMAAKAGKDGVPNEVIKVFSGGMKKVANRMEPGTYVIDKAKKAKGVAGKAKTVAKKAPSTATRGAVNRRSTVLTGGRGLNTAADIRRKTLLGT